MNADAALAWAQALPENGGQVEATRVVIKQMTNADPQLAWNLAVNFDASNPNTNLLRDVANKWVAIDPAQTAVAISALPEGPTLTSITGNVAGAWVKQDPTAASEWVNTLPAGDARDAAVMQIISVEGSNALPTAFDWALTITNATVQSNQLNSVVQQWAKKDPRAALAAVQTATMSDQQRQNLLNAINAANMPKN